MREKWRRVPDVPDLIASSEGRLMVIPHFKHVPRGGLRNFGGTPVVGQWDGSRYIIRHRGKTYRVARLVCAAFNGTPPSGAVCMHLDEDARNNKPSNLRWGTQRENLNAPGFLAYCRGRTGENSPIAKARTKRAAAIQRELTRDGERRP